MLETSNTNHKIFHEKIEDDEDEIDNELLEVPLLK